MIFFKAPGSPLFCKSSNDAYGLAGIYFGQKYGKYNIRQRFAFFAITGKWRKDFISKIVNGKSGNYRILWINPNIRHRKGSGSLRMQTPCIIWFYVFCLVLNIVPTDKLINKNWSKYIKHKNPKVSQLSLHQGKDRFTKNLTNAVLHCIITAFVIFFIDQALTRRNHGSFKTPVCYFLFSITITQLQIQHYSTYCINCLN